MEPSQLKNLFLAFTIVIGTIGASAQTLKQATKALKKTTSLEDLDGLKEKHPDWNITIDKTVLTDSSDFPEIVKAKKGDILIKQYYPTAPTFVMKVMVLDSTELCKVNYIVFSGREYSREKIDSIRKVILSKYKAGESFESLAAQYHTDGNKTGDLEWFPKGMMVEEFDKGVRNRTKGEIFTVDVEKNQWYYVVLKTHDNKMEQAVTSLRIQYH